MKRKRERETDRAVVEAPNEWPQGEREGERDHQREGKEEREIERESVKLMQLRSRTNVFGADEYRSHISSDCSLPSTEPVSCISIKILYDLEHVWTQALLILLL